VAKFTRWQSGYYRYNRSSNPGVIRSSYIGECPGIRIGIKLDYKPVPGTIMAHMNGLKVSHHLEGHICWIDFIAVNGSKWDVRYEEETWESRARRTWNAKRC